MFHWLATVHPLAWPLQSLEIRASLAALTAFFLVLACGGLLISWLLRRQALQSVRTEGPQSHLAKSGTPTMGGVLILGALFISLLLWADLTNRLLWVITFVMLVFAVIGAVDDLLKIRASSSAGLPGRWKYFWQTLVAVTAVVYLYTTAAGRVETELHVPFWQSLSLGAGYVLFSYLVITGSSNAMNLTDGLDGLAASLTILLALGLGALAYLAAYGVAGLPSVFGGSEVALFCAALAGAVSGFFWFNRHPARIFMGDLGSLSIGAALGTIAVVIRQEVLFAFMAIVLVMETVSVVLQVLSYQITGKRIFLMAPLHHHFEHKGHSEVAIVRGFFLVTAALVAAPLLSVVVRL